ncbi:hypothetical protein [Robertmurraya sp. FSL R5-0851]|uniref:hypothetical protein n=1 Tax=Robertmurraya sp. FSL R5-0851 TaxID=2921584 RepID=UPI0030FC1C77
MDIDKKRVLKYDEPYLIRFEGEGRKQIEISRAYIELIEKGYSLAVEEVSSYLRCSYQYVIKKIVPEVPHIRITEVSKLMLMRYATNHIIDETMIPLFNKRILFNRFEFEQYICNKAEKVITYKRFYEKDFDPAAVLEIKEKLLTLNHAKKAQPVSFRNHMQRVMDSFIWKDFENNTRVIPIDSFPLSLKSQRDLVSEWGLKYKVNFYRRIETQGINKVRIGNLIRFDKQMVEEEYLAHMYISVYYRLKVNYGGALTKIIQDRAIELLE